MLNVIEKAHHSAVNYSAKKAHEEDSQNDEKKCLT
jgi:hypothetical protein